MNISLLRKAKVKSWTRVKSGSRTMSGAGARTGFWCWSLSWSRSGSES